MTERNPIALFVEQIPGNALLGLTVPEVGVGTATVELAQRDEVTNHVGTMHAAALFGICDATSGAAMSSALGDKLFSVTPIASGGEIAYKRPARGVITGRASLSDDQVAELHAQLEADGVARPHVEIELTDADATVVATAVFHWHVKVLPPV